MVAGESRLESLLTDTCSMHLKPENANHPVFRAKGLRSVFATLCSTPMTRGSMKKGPLRALERACLLPYGGIASSSFGLHDFTKGLSALWRYPHRNYRSPQDAHGKCILNFDTISKGSATDFLLFISVRKFLRESRAMPYDGYYDQAVGRLNRHHLQVAINTSAGIEKPQV